MVKAPPTLSFDDAPIKAGTLLVVDEVEESAKRIESRLRSAGHRIRARWIKDISALGPELERIRPDLMLISVRQDLSLLQTAVEQVRRVAPALPVLALSEQLTQDQVASVTELGASDLVATGSARLQAHLLRVCLREFHRYRQWRALAKTRARLADYEARYAQLMSGTADAVAHISEGIINEANPAFASLLGHETGEALIGLPLMDMVAATDQARIKAQLRKLSQGKSDQGKLDCALLDQAGDALRVKAQLTRSDSGGEQLIELLIRAEAANEDQATAIAPNRGALFSALQTAQRSNSGQHLLLVVVDSMHTLEERVGYDEVELVLEQLATKLSNHLDQNERLFEFSKHEFAVLLGRHREHTVGAFAESICSGVGGQVFSTPRHETQLSVSVGVCKLSADETIAEQMGQLVRDTRRISAGGGAQTQMVGAANQARMQERESEQKAQWVRQAFDQQRVRLAYQTIASLEGEQIQHYDVLLRLIDVQGQEVPATEFIRAAEKFDLMQRIDHWVIERVLQALNQTKPRPSGSILFVRLSECSLKQLDEFVKWIKPALKKVPVQPGELCLGIPEKALQNHLRKATLLLEFLHSANIGFAIDRFGGSANSAQLLNHLDVDFLKFHRSFTHHFDREANQRKIANLMGLAKQKGIKSIVSHVEDADVMARMWQMGVNYIQGYHIQQPETLELADGSQAS